MIREARAIADLSQGPGRLWQIHRINVPVAYRGQGFGRRLLNDICSDADAEGASLWLLPIPSDGLSYTKLVAWYERRGFGWAGEPGRSEMVRPPNTR